MIAQDFPLNAESIFNQLIFSILQNKEKDYKTNKLFQKKHHSNDSDLVDNKTSGNQPQVTLGDPVEKCWVGGRQVANFAQVLPTTPPESTGRPNGGAKPPPVRTTSKHTQP
jgi:hypothetical protein